MIYLDAATTLAPSDDLILHVQDTLKTQWGNVSGSHAVSRNAKSLLELSRENVANTCGVNPDNIVFTSGASDALNIVIQGFARKHSEATIYCSKTEHDAVYKTCEFVNAQFINVHKDGLIDLNDLANVKKGDLVCVMAVNNETAIVQDIEAISNFVHDKEAFLLVDAVQSFYSYSANQICSWADYAVFSGHKLGSLQGVGMLMIKDRKSISSLMYGGSQEWELRPGTTPAYLCNAFMEVFCAKYQDDNRQSEIDHVEKLRDEVEKLLGKIDQVSFNSYEARRSPHISSVRIDGIESQMLIAMLDERDICVSKGSACASGASTPSRVLKSMGLSDDQALSTIRISFSNKNTIDEMQTAVGAILQCVKTLRSFSDKLVTN